MALTVKTTTVRRVRRSIQELQDDFAKGKKKALEDLMRAWKGIKELPPDNPHSFFMLGGYHGEPFRGAGWGSSSYWGGYCNHGNILFPTWHRVYLVKLEEALQSISGCKDVMLPFWDETGDESVKNGIPWALTQKDFVLDGKTIRYPLSGLVGAAADKAATERHNEQYPNYDANVKLLNENVLVWLNSQIVVNGKVILTNVKGKYAACLDAPNYTVFSNTTSSAQWNEDLDIGVAPVVALESPHNSIHLAVGGCDVPTYDRPPIEAAI